MTGFLKLTAYQLSVIEQKYEEHTVMTGLLLWLKGMYTSDPRRLLKDLEVVLFSGLFCWFHSCDSKKSLVA